MTATSAPPIVIPLRLSKMEDPFKVLSQYMHVKVIFQSETFKMAEDRVRFVVATAALHSGLGAGVL